MRYLFGETRTRWAGVLCRLGGVHVSLGVGRLRTFPPRTARVRKVVSTLNSEPPIRPTPAASHPDTAPAASSAARHRGRVAPAAQARAELPRPYIVAIGGGKGGVGKSLISANLSLMLAKRGHDVVLFDADLGGANAHTCLGMPAPRASVADFVRRQVVDLAEVTVPTGFDNLRLVSGALDWMQAANPRAQDKARLGEALLRLDTDVLVVDLGAGTSLHTIDFFLLAHQGIVALVPEPTAIENAYRFMKMACIRRLQAIELSWYARPVLGRALDEQGGKGLRSPAELLREVREQDATLGARLKHELERHPFHLVVNQVRSRDEAELAEGIKQACRRYFGVSIDATFSIPFDDSAWQAVRRRRPLVEEHPDGIVASGIDAIARSIERTLA